MMNAMKIKDILGSISTFENDVRAVLYTMMHKLRKIFQTFELNGCIENERQIC